MAQNDKFLKDLEMGKFYEKKAQEHLYKKFNRITIKECNNYKYDFKCNQNYKYEVKADKCSNYTNNFFIEILSYNNPSGIQTTHADYYIITDTNKYYLIEVDILKKLISELGDTKKLVYTKDKSSLGYIINKNVIINLSIILN